MPDIIRLVGPNQAVELLGIRLVGINAENGKKLLLTLVLVVLILLLARLLRALAGWALRDRRHERLVFWIRQAIHLATALILLIGLASIWFDDPTRLATALGLVTAGLAFALQRVITALAGYFVILRSRTFNVGDRIRMGGVRGDVIALSFMQTTIMEMGQPPPVQGDEPAMWVKSRQYTGRVVTISNAQIFEEPVYNYTSEFPYLWEEMTIPIPYTADRGRAERILLEVAHRHTLTLSDLSAETLRELQRRYFIDAAGVEPRVYFNLTDNWLALTVRFIARDHGIRELKDAMTREMLQALDAAGIGIASATFEIVGLPPLRLQREKHDPPRSGSHG
jgi:small-conductance mechanosensitive channel